MTDNYTRVMSALLLSLAVAAALSLFSPQRVEDIYLDLEILADKPTVIQVFYDTGDGFKQELRSSSRLAGQALEDHLRFMLPADPVSRIRIDFGKPAREIFLKNGRLICLSNSKEFPLNLAKLEPAYNVEPIGHEATGVRLTATGPDPQVVLSMTEFLPLKRLSIRLSVVLALMVYPVCWLLISFTCYKCNLMRHRDCLRSQKKNLLHKILICSAVILWISGGLYCWYANISNKSLLEQQEAFSQRVYNTPFDTIEKELLRPDGLGIKAFLYKPIAGTSAPYPAFLLLHGNYPAGQQHPMYRVLARELANKGYLVMTMDFAGYGQSDDPFEREETVDLSMKTETRAALDYLAGMPEVQPDSIGIIGHSMGADLALSIGAEAAAVSTITLIGPPRRVQERFHSPSDTGFFWYWANKIRKVQYGEVLFPDWYVKERWRSDILHRDMVYMIPYLSQMVHKPILFIDGEREPGTDKSFLYQYVKRCSFPKKYVTLPKADHDCNVKQHGEKILFDPATMTHLVETIVGWQTRAERKMPGLFDYFRNVINLVFSPVRVISC